MNPNRLRRAARFRVPAGFRGPAVAVWPRHSPPARPAEAKSEDGAPREAIEDFFTVAAVPFPRGSASISSLQDRPASSDFRPIAGEDGRAVHADHRVVRRPAAHGRADTGSQSDRVRPVEDDWKLTDSDKVLSLNREYSLVRRGAVERCCRDVEAVREPGVERDGARRGAVTGDSAVVGRFGAARFVTGDVVVKVTPLTGPHVENENSRVEKAVL